MHLHLTSRVTSYWARYLLISAFILLVITGVAAAVNLFPDPVFPTGIQPGAVAAADFNVDGKIDLATVNSNDRSILLALGGGEFERELRLSMVGGATWLAAADFNADGKIDLAVTQDTNNLQILLGAGNGTFF